jgi:hypothetical protein
MGILSRTIVRWVVLVCALIGAACPGVVAIWLFAEGVERNHSREGNILRLGFGMLLFLISALAFGIAAIYLKSFRDRSRSQSQYIPSDR